MVKNIIFYIVMGLTIITVFYYLSATSSSKYSESINIRHEEQQKSLAKGDSLQLRKELMYFTVDKKYITTAKVNVYDSMKTIFVQFLKNKETVPYVCIATLSFDLKGKPQHLTLFKNIESGDFVLPFTDSTNLEETHSTGRYLPVDFHGQEYLDLDFNLAYNPYCAYDNSYSCAVTPPDNHISLKVEAGELRY